MSEHIIDSMRERYQPVERRTGHPTLLECFGFQQREYTKPGSLGCRRLTRAFQPIRCHPEAEPHPRQCMFSSFKVCRSRFDQAMMNISTYLDLFVGNSFFQQGLDMPHCVSARCSQSHVWTVTLKQSGWWGTRPWPVTAALWWAVSWSQAPSLTARRMRMLAGLVWEWLKAFYVYIIFPVCQTCN